MSLSSHDYVVDGDVDELHEEADEAHHQEADGCGLRNLQKFYQEKTTGEGRKRGDGVKYPRMVRVMFQRVWTVVSPQKNERMVQNLDQHSVYRFETTGR